MSANATRPSKVMLIRHGEKLGNPDDESGGPNLSIRGSARAAALPLLFLPANPAVGCQIDTGTYSLTQSYSREQFNDALPRFDTPDFVIATADSDKSHRRRQTVTPTAVALGKPFDYTSYTKSPADIARLAQDIRSGAKYAGKVVLICWHHGCIQTVAKQLGATQAPKWPGSQIFDRVWVIDFANGTSGAPAFADKPQKLLYGDSDHEPSAT
jgi:hypothetical protein